MTIQKPFLSVARDKKSLNEEFPWWMMRQAGRYLPEYRDLRAKAGDFLDLVYNSDLASEVTIQPLRRYDMSVAILFSDILVVPQALGQEVWFETGEGPKLAPVKQNQLNFAKFEETLFPISQTIAKVREKMAEERFDRTTLVGFCGAPWTVACYMIEGGGSRDFSKVKEMAFGQSEEFQKLIDMLVEASTQYILQQIRAGVEAVQIFDSWAVLLDEPAFNRYVIEPTKKIIAAVRNDYPDVPIIGFPRGAGPLYLDYVQSTGVDVVNIDSGIPTAWAARVLQPHCAVQGNLHPMRLLGSDDDLAFSVEKIKADLKGGRFIFNLGHGVAKQTDPKKIDLLKDLLYT